MPRIFRFTLITVAFTISHLAHSAPVIFHDPLDVAALPNLIATRTMLVGGARIPGGRLVVVGRRGLILTSDDGGASWLQSRVPVSTDLLAVSFPTTKQGWAVGHAGVVLHTGDGGLTWERQIDGRTLPDLLIAHSKAAAAAGDESAQRDLKEAQRFKEDGPGRPLLDVHFTDILHGMVVGAYNLALRTEDGGRTWTPISNLIENPEGMHLYGLADIDGTLWIAGEQGLVLKQNLLTGRFMRMPTPYAGTFFGVVGNANDIVVYGLRGHALRSGDGGTTWVELHSGTRSNLTSGAMLADGRLVISTLAGELLETRNGADKLAALPIAQPMPLYGVTTAGDGNLLLTGAGGLRVQAFGMTAKGQAKPTLIALPARAITNTPSEAR